MTEIRGFEPSPQQVALQRACASHGEAVFMSVLAVRCGSGFDATRLEAERLGAALRGCVSRHEVLRTRLERLPGVTRPLQVIAAEPEFAMNFEARSEWSLPALEAELRAWGALATPGLAVWVLQSSDERLVALKAPGWMADALSLRLLMHELLGGGSDECGLEYADYAQWKLDAVEGEFDVESARYWQQWRGQRANGRVALEVPAALRSAARFSPTQIELPSDPETMAKLDAHARVLGASGPELLFSLFGGWVARLSDQRTVELGWVDTGRGGELDAAVGPYAQVLPVRQVFELGRSLAEQWPVLSANRAEALRHADAYAGEDDPTYVFASRQSCAATLPAGVTPIYQHALERPFALRLTCEDDGSKLCCRLECDAERFPAAARGYVAEQWMRLVRGFLRQPQQALGRIELIGPAQLRALAVPAPVPAVEDVSVLELIARSVARVPDAAALIDRTGAMSYRELGAAIEHIAHELGQRGVGPGVSVGVAMARGREAIACMLAVLRTGASYIPLDPGYPLQRLQHALSDGGARFVIADATTPAALAERATWLDARALQEGDRGLLAATNAHAVDLERPAYVIYTSGSSGRPKGVEIGHRPLSHSTQVRMAYYPTPVRAFLLLSPLAFDSSVAGIYWTLAQGGALVIAPPADALSLGELGALIAHHRITHGLSLPSLHAALLRHVERSQWTSVQTWIVAGEACSESTLQQHLEVLPEVALVNEYGPTEATVWATAQVLDQDALARGVSIGRAIPGVELTLVNEWGATAGLGERGEIRIGGATLARGYRGDAEKTAAAFVSDAAIAAGARMYCTGDVGWYRSDGCLMFAGRRDRQVKVRGHRVELAEVEAALCAERAVELAAVIGAPQPGEGGVRLLAFVVPMLSAALDPERLRRSLAQQLPGPMVPAEIRVLSALPRLDNGKVDADALLRLAPAPEAAEYAAPRTELERELAEICAEVLQRPRVGVHDDFFRIGGDSILSLQVVARAAQRGIALSAKQLLQAQTVKQMARLATRRTMPRVAYSSRFERRVDERIAEGLRRTAAYAHASELELWAALLHHCLARPGESLQIAIVAEAGASLSADDARPYALSAARHDWPSLLPAVKSTLRDSRARVDAPADVQLELGSEGSASLEDESAGLAPLRLRVLTDGAGATGLSWASDVSRDRAELERLDHRIEAALHALIEHSANAPALAARASDFPSAGIDDTALLAVLRELNPLSD